MRICPGTTGLIGFVVVGLCLSAPSTTRASEWRDTFEPGVVASYVDMDDAAVMVVGAGNEDSGLDDAVDALIEALDDSRHIRLVMDAASLGDIGELSDSEIVRRTAAFPIDRIAVVRLFGDGGSGTTVVVTFYDKDANARDALSAGLGDDLDRSSTSRADGGDDFDREGDRVADRDDRRDWEDDQDRDDDEDGERVASDSRGISADTARAVSEAIGGSDDSLSAAEQYERKHLWFQDYVGVSTSSGAVVAHWSKLYRGKYKEPVNGGEFYEIIGRRDLLEEYQTGMAVKIVFTAVGHGVGIPMLIGGAVETVKAIEGGYDDPFGDPSPEVKGAVAAMVVGGSLWGVMAIVGFSLNPHPVDMTQARELVDDYNRALRKELGLREPRSELRLRDRSHRGLSIQIAAGPTGVFVHGRF